MVLKYFPLLLSSLIKNLCSFAFLGIFNNMYLKFRGANNSDQNCVIVSFCCRLAQTVLDSLNRSHMSRSCRSCASLCKPVE